MLITWWTKKLTENLRPYVITLYPEKEGQWPRHLSDDTAAMDFLPGWPWLDPAESISIALLCIYARLQICSSQDYEEGHYAGHLHWAKSHRAQDLEPTYLHGVNMREGQHGQACQSTPNETGLYLRAYRTEDQTYKDNWIYKSSHHNPYLKQKYTITGPDIISYNATINPNTQETDTHTYKDTQIDTYIDRNRQKLKRRKKIISSQHQYRHKLSVINQGQW